jgi:integrase
MSQVYQRGSIRKVTRASGKQVWEWRYRVSGVMKQEMFPAAEYKSEKALWRHLQSRLELLNAGEKPVVPETPVVTMGTLIQKYKDKYLPGLAKSTRDTDESMLKCHFIHRWETTLVTHVKAEAVEDWIKTLVGQDGKPLSSASKGRARRLMKQLIDRAMFWEMMPTGANVITLVRVKGSTKREKKIVLLTAEQVNKLIAALPMPYSLMVLVGASLGLRVEEIIPLQWGDFDWQNKSVMIRRAYTHSELKEPKSDASWTSLPVPQMLLDALTAYRTSDSMWVFPSPVTGGCMSADTILAKKIKPVAAELGLPKIGWHTLRHSYKAWQSSGTATLSQLKDLMRHSDITTTANIYGGTPVEDMRPYVDAIADKLRSKAA